MSRTGDFRRAGPPACLALLVGLALAEAVGSARAQDGPNRSPAPRATNLVPAPSVFPPSGPTPLGPTPTVEPLPGAPGTAVVGDGTVEAAPAPALPADVQVVRFQGPKGLAVEILGPAPEAVPTGDGKGILTVGLKVGVGYRLRLSSLPDRPGVELFPVIEMVGHLHRPASIDPGKYPVRVVFDEDDLTDAADHGRLVTRVVYLEDPDLALPEKLGKDEPPGVTLNPAEEPLKVAEALGRVMAIIRIGARRPVPEEMGMPLADGLARSACPFNVGDGSPCKLPCGPVCGTPPPTGRPWLPRDEYLCDGGDRALPIHFGGDGGLRGIDPRDAVVRFVDDKRARVLPTNTVCIYAPRFASVRASVGANESLSVVSPRLSERVEKEFQAQARQAPRRLAQNTTAETNRHRSRASGLSGRVFAGEHAELRVLSGYDSSTHVGGNVLVQGPNGVKGRVKPILNRDRVRPILLRNPEAVVMTGIVEGAGQAVMTWTPLEVAGVETPPNRPGIAVIKQVSADQAEPGDVVTYTIKFKNMGNTPIRAVSIVDSLMPRLEYVPRSATGPAGTVFTSGENQARSLELRWDLPGALAPGVEGAVTFQAIVR